MDNPENTPIWYGIGEGSEVEIDPERKVELLAVTAYPKTHNNKNEEKRLKTHEGRYGNPRNGAL